MTVSVEVPAKVAGSGASTTTAPDLDYAGVLSANSTVTANNGAEFTLLDDVNFKASSSLDRMEVELLDPGSGA